MYDFNNNDFFKTISKRYQGVTPDALIAVLCPLLVPIRTLDKTIIKLEKQSHYRASFTIEITKENKSVLQVGRTGKFIPEAFQAGKGPWREIVKGRIINIDYQNGIAEGEMYTGSGKTALKKALEELTDQDFLEIDQYGSAAKILSGLAEFYLAEQAKQEGYEVVRMPEDMARHLGAYANFDFIFKKDGIEKNVEAKSIWGTNTKYARLIHSTTTKPRGNEETWTERQKLNYYPTSSCKFATQDIFAVSLFLRTGNIKDFAFAHSVSNQIKPYGLPPSSGFIEHVHQNPKCEIGNGSWFSTIGEVWELD